MAMFKYENILIHAFGVSSMNSTFMKRKIPVLTPGQGII